MSGRHKFSELEAGMTPQRRARIDKLAQKLDRAVREPEAAPGGEVNYRRLAELAEEFTTLWTHLQALYLDAIVGFAFIRNHVQASQAQARGYVAGTELDSEAFQDTRMFTYSRIFKDAAWTAGIHEFTQAAGIHPTQGEVKARNQPNGDNFVTLGQLCIIRFYDFWNDYLRQEYVLAKGLLNQDKLDSERVREQLRIHASHDLWGDLYYFRTSIVHKQGIANADVAKCKRLKWFKPGDPLTVTPLHMRAIFLELLTYRNELFREQFPRQTFTIPDWGA